MNRLLLALFLLGIPLLVLNFFYWHPEFWEMFRLWLRGR
jgi:hypothetical protein